MQKRVLRLAVGIGASFAALTTTTWAERPDDRADGSVRVGARVFPTRAAYYASPEFQHSGARCGSIEVPVVDPLALTAADCSVQNTTINAEYDDDRVIVIQVVFHVIKRSDGLGDLSPALIRSQIDILNEDFGALPGTPGAPGTNTRIQFVLARFDPNGQPTNGIDVVTNDAYFTDPGPGPNPMKTALRWDPTRYLNVYTNDAAGNLGYATFPQASAGTDLDGVVLLWSAVGRYSRGGPPYNLGRTATHEIGHYLGLFHTFQGQCGSPAQPYSSGDLIADTIRERDPHFGCAPAASVCQGAGMSPIENYMNYSDDACMDRFTVEQANRMRCAIMNYRAVNTAPRAQFTYVATDTGATFTNTSSDLESPLAMLKSRWRFGDGTISTEASPTHTYARAGSYQVTLEVIDPGSGTATATELVVVGAAPSTPDAGTVSGDAAGVEDRAAEGGGCCQARHGDVAFLGCALPVVLALRRRRARRPA